MLNHFNLADEFLGFVEREKQQLDCLILQAHPKLEDLSDRLKEKATLLPAVILHRDPQGITEQDPSPAHEAREGFVNVDKAFENGEMIFSNVFYHTAEAHLSFAQIDRIARYVDQAIAQFLNLAPTFSGTQEAILAPDPTSEPTQNFLIPQQRRLSEKLRERLGYLGVYYKRNPQRFFRNLPLAERQQFLEEIKVDYREIVLSYFSTDSTLNQKIDEFVNTAFLADISVTQIVEIHMELMDDFSKQLKLEGRSEEILLDYRLTLIDVIAHLCEMYRRSIPRDS